MEKVMNRIELIKKVAKKIEWQRKNDFNKMLVEARRWSNQKEKVVVEKVDNEYTDDVIAKLDDNSFNHWHDGSKFAEVHYGDVAKSTTKEWDNE